MSVHSESVYSHIRLDRLDIMYGERERNVTILCLKGGREWSTAAGLGACGVDWNGHNKCTHSHIF